MSIYDIHDILTSMEKRSNRQRQKATNMMVPMMLINLPDEIMKYTSTFLFYDIESHAYEEKKKTDYYKAVMKCVVDELTTSFFSRRSCSTWGGFCVVINEMDIHRKTIYGYFCHRCGQCIEESLFPRHVRTLCTCDAQLLSDEIYKYYYENDLTEEY